MIWSEIMLHMLKQREALIIQENIHNRSFYEALMQDEIITNSAGGKQSKVSGRFDLLPPHALDRIARILEAGAEKYGEWNWRNIPSKDHLNHAINHLFKYIADDQSEDHLGNAGCRILFLLDMIFIESRDKGEPHYH